jgi:hypothetical protein
MAERITTYDIDEENPTVAFEYKGKRYGLDKYDALFEKGATLDTIFYVLKNGSKVCPGKFTSSTDDIKIVDDIGYI